MPTRLYITAAAAPVTPDSSVYTAAGTQTWELPATPPGASLLARAEEWPGATTFATASQAETLTTNAVDVCCRQFVSDPLAAQTISGTLNGQMKMRENNNAANSLPVLMVKVVSRDGQTLRGVLYGGDSRTTNVDELTNVLRNQRNPATGVSPVTLASVNAQLGDRIVIEVGGRHINTVATSYATELRYGSLASAGGANDHVVGGTETGDLNGWVEFANDLTFEAAPPQNTNARFGNWRKDGSPIYGTLFGEQTMRAYVRKAGPGGNPQGRVELRLAEQSSAPAGYTPPADVAVSSTSGTYLETTWDADALGITDPNQVEMVVIGTGAPGGTLEIASVGNTTTPHEWVAQITEGGPPPTKELAGSAAGASTTSAALRVRKPLAGSAAGSATAEGTLDVKPPAPVQVAGLSEGSSIALGTLRVRKPLAGTAAGSATTTARLGIKRLLATSTSGSATATGTLSVTHKLAASAAGSATATGTLRVRRVLQGSAAGSSTASGTLKVVHNLAGSASGAASTFADLQVKRGLEARSYGSSTAVGTLRVVHSLYGAAAGSSTAEGTIRVKKPVAGSAAGSASTSATLQVRRLLAGTSAGSSTASGTLQVRRRLAGTAAGSSTAEGTLQVRKPLAGSAEGWSSTSAKLQVQKPVAGSAAGSSSASGTLRVRKPLAGTASGSSSASAKLWHHHKMRGFAAGIAAVSAALNRGELPGYWEYTTQGSSEAYATLYQAYFLQGEAHGSSEAYGTLGPGTIYLAGEASGGSAAEATLWAPNRELAGEAHGSAEAIATLSQHHQLAGIATSYSTAVATLVIHHYLSTKRFIGTGG